VNAREYLEPAAFDYANRNGCADDPHAGVLRLIEPACGRAALPRSEKDVYRETMEGPCGCDT
jgi:hypothetical protein